MKILNSRGRKALSFKFMLLAVVFLSSVGWSGTFSDDFEDGALGSWWYEKDGSVSDADETGGVLHLSGPDPEAVQVGDLLTVRHTELNGFLVTGDFLAATFEAINPPPDTAYGITVGKMDLSDEVLIMVYHDSELSRGTMIMVADEEAFIAPAYSDPHAVYVDIPEFVAGDTITLKLLVESYSTAAAFYSINGQPFTRIGTISTPYSWMTAALFGGNWPPSALGAQTYDFPVSQFDFYFYHLSSDVSAGGGPDTFQDDFDDTTTFLPPENPNTLWDLITPAAGTVSSDSGSGAAGYSARLTNSDLNFRGPVLGTENGKVYDLFDSIIEAEIRINNFSGQGGIGFGVPDDTNQYICAGIGAALAFNGYNWDFVLFDSDDNDLQPYLIDAITVDLDPGQFHRIRMETNDSEVSATLDGIWSLQGFGRLPIHVAGAGVYVESFGDFSFDNFGMSAKVDGRSLVFGDVQLLADTPADEMFPVWSRDGRLLAFVEDEMDTGPWNIWVKSLNPPAPAVQCTSDADGVWLFGEPSFSPDLSHIVFTGTAGTYLGIKRVNADGSGDPETIYSAPDGNVKVSDISPSCNLLLATKELGDAIEGSNLLVLEAALDGTPVAGTEQFITNFPPGEGGPNDAHFDSTCNRIIFMATWNTYAPKIYMLTGVQDILNGIALPPTSYYDPRLVAVSTGYYYEFMGIPRFSPDGAYIYFSRDLAGTFNLFPLMADPSLPWSSNTAHFEIFAVDPDVPEVETRITNYRPYNQLFTGISPDGTLMIIASDNLSDGDGYIDPDLYLVNLLTRQPIVASAGGNIVDGGGTTVTFPAGSLSEDAVVTIKTPLAGYLPPTATLPAGKKNLAFTREIGVESDTAAIDPLNPAALVAHFLDADVARFYAPSLGVYAYNDDLSAWESLPGYVLDAVGKTFSGPLADFSIVGLAGAIDSDGDGVLDDGDSSDIAGDNICTGGAVENCDDNCSATPNPLQEDSDGDFTGEVCDNCPGVANPTQGDADGDGIGDACDTCPYDPDNDIDGDGVCGDIDNCPGTPNAGQEDCNLNGMGDACDPINPLADDSNCDGIDDNCNGTADDQYVPAPTSCGIGECAASGEMACVAGVLQDTCTPGSPTGLDDDCDGLDQDCDGIPDNNYIPTATSCGIGECTASGEMACVDGILQDTCTPGLPTDLDDECDGLDQNCNGTADENYTPTTTSCGVGVCEASGQMDCVGGVLQDTCTPGSPTGLDDDCDGLDQNCSGTADENYSPTATNCGVGECAASGEMACVGGALQDTCTPGSPTGLDDDCDGLDQNCNGVPDDAYVATPTSCGVGECTASGQMECIAGALEDTCTPGSPTGLDDDCDGLDQDCDGTPDDAYVPTATNCGVGECAASGETVCVGGVLQDTCTPGSPTGLDDECDGLDQNCDGVPDNNYLPTTTNCGVGECTASGEVICSDGTLQDTCTPGSPTGPDDDCDGLDQNCNGTADENYTPTATNCGVGECTASGEIACVAGALQDTCTPGSPTGLDDDCDGLDQNCNGIPDDAYVPTPTSCGTGECAASGQMDCVAGVLQDTCTPGSPTGLDDECDGLDQNCNGTADENYTPAPTTCGEGVCVSSGQLNCVGGVLQDTCTPGSPTGLDDECDGLDQNCNGIPDDAYVPTTTNCGIGECAASGEMACVAGALQDTCTPGSPTGLDDECDGLDQNCNGVPDDAYVPTATNCGVGECAASGETVCVGGVLQDTCTPGSPTGLDDECDGVDQNCNGTADENYTPTATSCGVGECVASGQMECVAGALQDTCTPGPPTGLDDDCDGVDQNCNGIPDDAYVPTATNCGVGECVASGEMECVGGVLQDTCTPGSPTGADDECDGLDQNCNGIPDDAYVPTSTNCGVGECTASGEMACVAGSLQDTCTPGSPTGADDECDGLDQNCNGIPDDAYVPTATSCGVGECTASGQMDCVAGVLQDTCTPGSPTGLDDDCDGLDQNCNGIPDDAYVPTTTNCGVGVCEASGQMDCVGGVLQDTCTPGSPTGADDECDGLDQNCDGVPDNNYLPTATSCGVGECAASGQMECVTGALQDTCTPGSPTGLDDECDGLDQNCNGIPDDAYVPTATSCGVGECTASGEMTCVAGALQDTCTPGSPTGLDDDCDGLDQNCNGIPDDAYVSTPTSCGTGECAASGQMICSSGTLQDTCSPGSPTGLDDECDGLDQNCDGVADNNYLSTTTDCGIGECAATGSLDCVGGTFVDTCLPGSPADEICDGLDNNCNGDIDDGLQFLTYYQDADGDQYGNASVTTDACSLPAGYVADSTDCNDADALVNPGMAEAFCNDIDDDCNPATLDDITPPELSCPEDIQADYECGGTPVDNPAIQTFLQSAGAVDDCDGSVPVTDDAPAVFPLGATVVTFDATDIDGNPASCQASVNVQYQYSGILQPINADDSSVFPIGKCVPIRFALSCSGATPVGTATATLEVTKISDSITGTITETEVIPPGLADSGNLFRYNAAEQRYEYNWLTKYETEGTYQITISLDDGATYGAVFSLAPK